MQGETALVKRRIEIAGRVAFERGEAVAVAKVEPNAERPEYRYVVFSTGLGSWFYLSDADVAFPAPPVALPQPPSVPQTARSGNRLALLVAAGLAALAVVVIVAAVMLAGSGGGTTSRNSGALVCIDAGHGGSDTGALENGVAEKDVNLDIALRARALLEDEGYRVIMTREKDQAVSLAQRCATARSSGAVLVLSIHNNSRPPDVQGTTTYYFQGSAGGERLAASVQSAVVAQIGRPDRGLRPSRLYMVRNVDVPSALLEGVFLSDPTEARLSSDPGFRQKIALGVAAGIGSYLDSE